MSCRAPASRGSKRTRRARCRESAWYETVSGSEQRLARPTRETRLARMTATRTQPVPRTQARARIASRRGACSIWSGTCTSGWRIGATWQTVARIGRRASAATLAVSADPAPATATFRARCFATAVGTTARAPESSRCMPASARRIRSSPSGSGVPASRPGLWEFGSLTLGSTRVERAQPAPAM